MRILCDLDSVLNDLVPAWLDRYNNDYNDTLTEDMIDNWDWTKLVKPECGSKILNYLDDPTLFSILKPTEHSQEVIARWCLQGKHDVYVVSSATYKSMEAKVEWLQTYYRTIGLDHIIFATHKYIISGDLLIDDGPHNIECFPGRAVVYSKPWNKALIQRLPDRFAQGKGKIFIVKNWWDIENLVNNIEKLGDRVDQIT